MDRPLRKFVLYKARNIREMEKERKRLEEIRKDIIDSSPLPLDGMPKGKGGVSNPTESKALRLEKITTRIEKLDKEIKAIKEIRELLDPFMKVIYDETVVKYCYNMQAKADLLNMSYDTLRRNRGKILKLIAIRLGEYFEDDG